MILKSDTQLEIHFAGDAYSTIFGIASELIRGIHGFEITAKKARIYNGTVQVFQGTIKECIMFLSTIPGSIAYKCYLANSEKYVFAFSHTLKSVCNYNNLDYICLFDDKYSIDLEQYISARTFEERCNLVIEMDKILDKQKEISATEKQNIMTSIAEMQKQLAKEASAEHEVHDNVFVELINVLAFQGDLSTEQRLELIRHAVKNELKK